MIFADTSYFVALADRKDRWHKDAVRVSRTVTDDLVVSDLVIAETLTLIGHRGGGNPAQEFYRFFTDSCTIDFIDRPVLDESMSYHRQFNGKLSVADCASIVCMERRRIRAILSFDSDFDRVNGLTRLS